MKKSIIILTFLAAGTVFSNAVAIYKAPVSSLQEGLAYYWDFDYGSQDYGNRTDANTNPVSYVYQTDDSNWTGAWVAHTYHLEGGFGGNGGYYSYFGQNGTGAAQADTYATNLKLSSSGFSVALCVKSAIDDGNHLFSAKCENGKQVQFKLRDVKNRVKIDAPIAKSSPAESAPANVNFADEEWTRLVLIGTGTDVKVYIGESLVLNEAWDLGNSTITHFQIAGFLDSNWKSNCSIDDFAIWNRCLDQSEISFLSSNTAASAIPEPSLFGVLVGISALALAGTRRRNRKN